MAEEGGFEVFDLELDGAQVWGSGTQVGRPIGCRQRVDQCLFDERRVVRVVDVGERVQVGELDAAQLYWFAGGSAR